MTSRKKVRELLHSVIEQMVIYKYFLLCFFLPVAVLLIFSFVFFYKYSQAAQENLRDSYETRLASIATNLNRSFVQIENSVRLLANSSFYNLFYPPMGSGGVPPSISTEELAQASKTLLNYRISIDLSDTVFVLLKSSKLVLDNSGTSGQARFFNETNCFENYPEEFWVNYKPDSLTFRLLPPTMLENRFIGSSSPNPRRVLPFVTANISDFNGPNLISVNISQNQLNDLLASYKQTENEILCILDEEGRIIASTHYEAVEKMLETGKIREELLRNTSSFFETSYEGRQAVVRLANEQFQFGSHVLFSISPYREFYFPLILNQILFAVILLMGLVVFAMLTYLFRRRILQPMQALVQTLRRDSTRQPVSAKTNIFSYLNELTAAAISRSEVLEKDISTVSAVVAEQKIMNMLVDNDYLMGSEIKTFLDTHTDKFPYPGFCVSVLQPTFLHKFVHEFSDSDRQSVLEFLIKMLRLDLGGEVPCHVLYFQKNQIVAVLNVPEGFPVEDVQRRLEATISFFSYDREYVWVAAGIGRPSASYTGIGASYEEALTALNSVTPESGQTVRLYTEGIQPLHCEYTPADDNRLSYLLNSGQAGPAREFASGLLERNRARRLSVSETRQLYRYLFNTVRRCLEAKKTDPVPLMREDYIDLSRKLDQMSPEDLHAYFLLVLERYEEWLRTARKFNIEEVSRYMKEHFQEDLYLESVAQHFGITDKYLSRMFKDSLNVGFHEYLCGIRVEEAKRLLLETKMSVTKIGEEVGFNTHSTFFRTFKSCEGISPTQFRSLSKAGHE